MSLRNQSESLEPEELRSLLELSIRKHDERREALTGTAEPLTIAKLFEANYAELAVSDEFQGLVASIDWPRNSDGTMDWSMTFPSAAEGGDDEFRVSLLDREGYGLSRFPLYFQAVPKLEAPASGLDIAALYAAHPMVHRLKLVDPDLWQNLYTVMNSAPKIDRLSYFELFDSQSEDGHVMNPVVHLMRQAYMLMGRLMRRDDAARHHELLGYATPDEMPTDKTSVLTQ